jgi:hypothetical protein
MQIKLSDMSSILFILSPRPTEDPDKAAKYTTCLKSLSETSKTNQEIKRIGEGTFLLPASNGARPLAELCAATVPHNTSYTLIILDERTTLIATAST